MRQASIRLLICLLMLAVLPVSAQLTGTDSHDSELVKVVTHHARPADCLAAVAVNKIDGEMIVVPAQGFLIEPGVHTINGKATLDIANCPIKDNKLQISATPDLEVNFELGKTYYIGYYHKPENTEQWKLVVWKVE